MADPVKIQDLQGKSAIESTPPTVGQPQAGAFEAKMQGQPNNSPFTQGTTQVNGPTPMDLAKVDANQNRTPTIQSLLNQTTSIRGNLDQANSQLNYPNLQSGLHRPQTQLLKRHLQDVNEHINNTANALGVQPGILPPGSGSATIAHFLTWIGQGQDTMAAVQDQLQQMSKNPDSVNPADMMLAQQKMNQASNEIQYSTTLLGKVIDAIKNLMQTQL